MLLYRLNENIAAAIADKKCLRASLVILPVFKHNSTSGR